MLKSHARRPLPSHALDGRRAHRDAPPESGVGLRAAPLGSLVGAGPAMAALARHVERVLPTDVTVAIFGESGTGKELVARAIHESGPRHRGPFIAINCAAITPSLQESELFGHERGAFTGALQARQGCFELADRGTLFLDELGEMSPGAQAALLRTLQERTVRRVGGSTDVPVDVRIVCATRRDLKAELLAGRFREDLYFRLVVFPVELPPLRDRREDLPAIIAHALLRLQPEPRRIRSITPEALALLAEYSWPGNVRELLNVVQRCLLTCAGDEITAADVPVELCAPRSERTPAAAAHPACQASCKLSLCCSSQGVLPLEQIERQATLRAMELTGGNVRRAAEMLGVGRATLYRKLAAHKIPFAEAG